MGLVGIDEAASKKCSALTLDMLLKFGILEQDGEGMLQLTENWEAKLLDWRFRPLARLCQIDGFGGK